MEAPLRVEFPLRGAGWVAVQSPADRVPSHGTDVLAQRYAFDFIRVDERTRLHYHKAGWLRTLLLGVPTHECYAWGAPIHAPFEGEVARVVDGSPERSRVFPLREMAIAVKNALIFSPARLRAVVGNHVILRGNGVFAVFAHLSPGSTLVREGEHVTAGDVIGRVGHTGNSTSPHLHFQLMDSADPRSAKGLPCAFVAYEVLAADGWVRVENGIPGRADRIRA